MSDNRIGYTEDGMVFIVINSMLNGKPAQTIVQWKPEMARHVAKTITEAANKAEEYTTPIGIKQ